MGRRHGDLLSTETGRRLHLTLLVAWFVIGIPVSYYLRHSLAWLVVLAVYSIVAGHWSGFSSERTSEAAES